MNILPLVISMLLVFACLSITFIRDVKSTEMIAIFLKGYHHTDKAVRNALVKRSFNKIKIPSAKSEVKKPSSPRLIPPQEAEPMPPLETSKFYLRTLSLNLSTLHEHPLYEPLAAFLRLLYQERLFSKYEAPPGVEYLLIDAIISKTLQLPAAHQLSQLYLDDPLLKTLYYKMVKGTNQYSTTTGIPPLSHFISLEKSSKAIHINYASKRLIEVLFGEEVYQKIISFKREKNTAHLMAQDLQTLLSNDSKQSSLLTTIEPFLSYSKQRSTIKTLVRRDKHTKIGIERANLGV